MCYNTKPINFHQLNRATSNSSKLKATPTWSRSGSERQCMTSIALTCQLPTPKHKRYTCSRNPQALGRCTNNNRCNISLTCGTHCPKHAKNATNRAVTDSNCWQGFCDRRGLFCTRSVLATKATPSLVCGPDRFFSLHG